MAVALSLCLLAVSGLTYAAAEPGRLQGYAVRIELPAVSQTEQAPGIRAEPLVDLPQAAAPATEELPPAETDAAVPVTSLPTPTLVSASAPRSKVPGMIALRYNLSGGADAGDAIEVDKAISVGGNDAGRIPLRIDGNAKVYALGSRLAAIIAAQLGQGAVPPGLEQDFVSLERLRALGIAVRYDAIRDRLVLDPPAA